MNPADRLLSPLLGKVQEGLLVQHLTDLTGEGQGRASRAQQARAAEYLISSFRSFGLKVSLGRFEAYGATHRNIIATFPGEFSSARPLIVAAHYDTVDGSPGADDNASGLAVLLVAAKILGEVPLASPVQLVAFALEEKGLAGSREYVSRLRKQKRQIKGAIVLECVAYADHREGSQKMPPGVPIPVPSTGNFLAIIANTPSAGLKAGLETAIKRYVPGLPAVGLIVPGQGEGLPDVRRSDHAAFWEFGYPALMLTDTANFRNPHYHHPTDTIGTLDLGFLAGVSRGVIAGIIQLTLPESLTCAE